MKQNILFVVLSSYFWNTIFLAQGQSLEVCLDGSTCVVGIYKRGFQTYEAFLGIPYAKPPIGDLRFKNPVKADLWDGAISAKEPKQDCIQKNFQEEYPKIVGSEDCLYLNVYRPLHRSDENLPVLFYIHGGGFFSGSASPNAEGPEYFMDTKEVILVVPAYRLGPFGFLSTGDAEMSGNFGLKDQNLALKWVQEYISAFGGDPTRVTIFGHSAGATSVHFHMLSKASNGLFQNGILMSGTAEAPFAQPLHNPKVQVIDMAAAVGIQRANKLSSATLVQALQKVDSNKLLNAVDSLKSWDVYPVVNFRPSVEDSNTADSFLTKETFSSLAENPYSISVPWIIGNVPSKGEGTVIALQLTSSKTLQEQFNDNFNERFRTVLDLPGNVVSDDVIDRLVAKYMGGVANLNDHTTYGFLKILGDANFIYPTYKTIRTSLSAESADDSENSSDYDSDNSSSNHPDDSSAYDSDNSSAEDADNSSDNDSNNSSNYESKGESSSSESDSDNSSVSDLSADSVDSSESTSDYSLSSDSENSSSSDSEDKSSSSSSSEGDFDNSDQSTASNYRSIKTSLGDGTRTLIKFPHRFNHKSSGEDSDDSSAYDRDNSSRNDSDDSSAYDPDDSSENDSNNSSDDDSDNSSAYHPDESSSSSSSESDSDNSSAYRPDKSSSSSSSESDSDNSSAYHPDKSSSSSSSESDSDNSSESDSSSDSEDSSGSNSDDSSSSDSENSSSSDSDDSSSSDSEELTTQTTTMPATSVSDDSTTKLPEVATTNAPGPSTTDAPEIATTEAPEDSTTNAPEETTTDAAEITTTEAPEDSSTNAPEETTSDAAEITATEAPEDSSTNAPEETTSDAAEITAAEAPEDSTTNATEETTTDAAEITATETPEETTTDAAEITATESPEDLTTNAPEETTTDAAEITATEAPEETTTDAAEITTTVDPEDGTSQESVAETPQSRTKVSEDIDNNVTNLVGVIKFNYRGSYSNSDLKNVRPVHGDDALYLFKSPSTNVYGSLKKLPDAALIKRYVGLYVEFAQTGKVKEFESIGPCTRDVFAKGECNYLLIENDTELFQVDNNWNIERMQLWDDIYGI